MGSQPQVSICIPSYNGEKFIASALESVLRQSFTDLEVVIVDDHSIDQTVSIIKRFEDPRIKLIQNDYNLGMARNWNKSLSCSQGKYVKLLCGDDVLYPGCLARQVNILEASENAGAVLTICNRNVIDSRNNIVFRRKFPFGRGLIKGAKLIRESVRWGSNLIGEPAVGLFRRQLLGRTGPLEDSNPYLLDLALWAELLKHGDAFIDPAYLAGFRISDQTASATIGRRQAAFFRSFVRRLRQDRFYEITTFDWLLGYSLSFPWCLFRNLLITLYSKPA